MLDIGWPELLIVAVVLIIVVGPKDLPPMLRAFGRTTTKLRSMAAEFRGQFDEALREAELDDVKKTFDDARKLNPMQSIRDAVNPLKQTGNEIRADLEKTVRTPDAAKAAAKVDVPEPAMKLADGPPTIKPAAPAGSAAAGAKAPAKARGSKSAGSSKSKAKTPANTGAAKTTDAAKTAGSAETSSSAKTASSATAAGSAKASSGATGNAAKPVAKPKTATPAKAGVSKSAGSTRAAAKTPSKAAATKPAPRARKTKTGEGTA